jgi:hypothetical protein
MAPEIMTWATEVLIVITNLILVGFYRKMQKVEQLAQTVWGHPEDDGDGIVVELRRIAERTNANEDRSKQNAARLDSREDE